MTQSPKGQKRTTINPFWDEVKDILDEEPDWLKPLRAGLLSGSVRQSATYRAKFVRLYAWAVPDPASVRFVAKWLRPRAVEIGAGMGYWAWQVAQLGLDILAYDIHPPDRMRNAYHSPGWEDWDKEDPYGPSSTQMRETYHPILEGGSEMAAQHPDRTLFLCWPPYDKPMAYDSLQAYQGKRVVYIGEGSGGCTGDGNFHTALDESWEQVAYHSIANWRWDGIHDSIVVYGRKS